MGLHQLPSELIAPLIQLFAPELNVVELPPRTMITPTMEPQTLPRTESSDQFATLKRRKNGLRISLRHLRHTTLPQVSVAEKLVTFLLVRQLSAVLL